MRRFWLPVLLPVLLLGLMFTIFPYFATAAQTSDTPPVLPTAVASPVPATATPVSPNVGITEVISGIQGAEYFITWQSPTLLPNLPGAYHAPNRAHNLRTYFTPTQMRVIRRTDEVPTWEWGMELTEFGYEGQLFPLSPATLEVTENRIEYRRAVGAVPPEEGAVAVVEWYENDADGIEQGFTLPVAPPRQEAGAPLQLNLDISGSLTPRLGANGSEVSFLSEDGVVLITYNQLYAYDAAGTELPTAISVLYEGETPTSIQLQVYDQNAVYPLTIDPLLTSYSWFSTGEQLYGDYGYSVNSAGDVNDDGYDDIIIGAPRYDNGQTNEGQVFVFHGSATGLEPTAAWTGEANEAEAYYGYSVASAGDVNGDGYDDIVIGAPREDLTTTGRVHVYLGSATGITTTGSWSETGPDSIGMFGTSVASAGDVNDDGYDDVIIGAPYSANKSEGQAFVYLGSTSGLTTTGLWQVNGNQNFAHLGWSVSSAGDVNGDNFDDVLVGVPGYENSQTDEGAVFLYGGSGSGLTTTITWQAESNQGGARLGHAVAGAGDVNHDGYSDIIVGAPFYGSGQIWQIAEGHAFAWYGGSGGLGGSGIPGNADWHYESNLGQAKLGWAVSGAGDIDGDGDDEVVVGAPYFTDTMHEQGKVYLFDGGSGGLSVTPSWTEVGDDIDSWFGASVAGAGNVNGDEFADLIVGAYGHGFSGFFGVTGMVMVYPGIGVSITTDSPTLLGSPTTMSATVTAGSAFTFDWEYGDGITGTGDVVSHTYAAVGVYTVTVTGTEYSTVVTATAQVTVQEAITGLVALSSSPTIEGEPTYLSATVTTGTAPVFTWAFGDGTFDSGAALSHTYPAVGTYLATVTATNSVSEITDTVSVIVADPISGLLALNDGPTPLGLATALSATVTAGSNVDYAWDFGDGNSDTGAAVNHTYLTSGTFTATVTATNEISLMTATTTVVVDETLVGLGATNNSPQPVGGAVTLTATLTSGDPATYEWNFGDGITGTGAVAYHIYNEDGTYTAVVTASNTINVLTATTNVVIGDVVPPGTPFDLEEQGRTSRAVYLTWSMTDTETVDYVIYSGTVEVGISGDTTYAVRQLQPGTPHLFSVKARDGAGNLSVASNSIYVTTLADSGTSPNPDPSPIDSTIVSDIYRDTQFIYDNSITSPTIQVGMYPPTILPERVAVVRGMVAFDDAPLSGVRVTVKGHPEYGQTWTRADGAYDLVVNGGEVLTFEYHRAGYLPVQRHVELPLRQYQVVPLIILTMLDATSTTVELTGTSPMTVAVSSLVSDADGNRKSTLIFPENVTATMVMPDGTEQPITTLTVRATEYTVGDTGPRAMPGDLPTASGYTYAFELSVDEALAAEANSVQFSQPLINYTENFLGFPVGIDVPVGYFDRERDEWIAVPDGRVIEIVGITSGRADVDVTGDGNADTGTALSDLGITDAERDLLATQFSIGAQLWRTPIPHFTPYDCNWPYGPPVDAIPPDLPPPVANNDDIEDCCTVPGSIISPENQTLSEQFAIPGTPYDISYQSKRTRGMANSYTVDIPILSGTVDTLPESLLGIQVDLQVGGQLYSQIITTPTLTDGQSVGVSWDGLDGYGRMLQGETPGAVRVGYIYQSQYYTSPAEFEASFGRFSDAGVPISSVRGRESVTIWQESVISMGRFNPAAQKLGGWTLNVHHAYSPHGGQVYMGNGERISGPLDTGTYAGDQELKPIAGSGTHRGGFAWRWPVHPRGMTSLPDGTVVVADATYSRVWRIHPNGQMIPVAGSGVWCIGYDPDTNSCGEGGPALEASFATPEDVVVGEDGSLYIVDKGNHRVLRVLPNGIIVRVAGTGTAGSNASSIATEAHLNTPSGIALDDDGYLYIADTGNHRIRKVDLDLNTIATVVGIGTPGHSGDGDDAIAAQLNTPTDIFIKDDILYIADTNNYVVRKVEDGEITTIAGQGGLACFTRAACGSDGATPTTIRLHQVTDVMVTDVGIFILDVGANNNYVRLIQASDQKIYTIAGDDEEHDDPRDGIPVLDTTFYQLRAIAAAPSGGYYVSETNINRRIRLISSENPLTATVETFAGTGDGVGGLEEHRQRLILDQSNDIAFDSDNNLYIATQARILKIDDSGLVQVVAGNGLRWNNPGNDQADFQGNALEIPVAPQTIAVAPDGTIYFTERLLVGGWRVRKIDTDGFVMTVVGGGSRVDQDPDRGPFDMGIGTEFRVCYLGGIATAPNGQLYIADSAGDRIYLLRQDGTVVIVAGKGLIDPVGQPPHNFDCRNDLRDYTFGENLPATSVSLDFPTDVALAPNGNLYVLEKDRLLQIDGANLIATVAGSSANDPYLWPDVNGHHATEISFSGVELYGLAISPEDDIYLRGTNGIVHLGANGIATFVAGDPDSENPIACQSGEALSQHLTASEGFEYRIALDQEGFLYVPDDGNFELNRSKGCIMRLDPPDRPFGDGVKLSVSRDGSELYEFDREGRHLATYDARLQTELYQFEYNDDNLLVEITDRNGLVTTIVRDEEGTPSAIGSPYHQTTTLTITDDYLTAIATPADETTVFEYYTDTDIFSNVFNTGLLKRVTTPKNGSYEFSYNGGGLLLQDDNPVGGFTALEGEGGRGSRVVTMTNALGDVSTFWRRKVGNAYQRSSYGPNGFASREIPSSGGLRQTVVQGIGSDSVTTTTVTHTPDPRWGMRAPYLTERRVVDAAGEVIYVEAHTQTVILADPLDPFSLLTMTEVITVNSKVTTRVLVYSELTDRFTLTVTDPAGKVQVTQFDMLGRPDLVTTSGRAPVEYEYNANGQLISMTEGTGPSARVTEMSYDPATGFLLSVEDPEGGITGYERDAVGRVLTETLPTLHTVEYQYDLNGNLEYLTDTRNVVTRYQYDAHDQLLTTTVDYGNPLLGHRNVVSANTYDLAGNVTASIRDVGTGRANLTTGYEYVAIDASLNYMVATLTDTENHPTTYSYTPLGVAETITNARGLTSIYTYTEEGWLGAIETPDGVTTYQYYGASSPTKVGLLRQTIDPRGVATRYDYDPATGWLVSVTEGVTIVGALPAVNQVTTYAYNLHGQILTTTQGTAPNLTILGYDEFGRVDTVRNGANHTTTYSYDKLDRLVETTIGADVGSDSMTIAYDYDLGGRLESQTVDPGGLNLTTRYYYTTTTSSDTWSLQRIQDPRSNTTQMVYDSLGNISTTLDAMGYPWQSRYDNVGRLTFTRDPLNKTTNYQYDDMGRLYTVTDTLGYGTNYRYDAVGNLTQLIESRSLTETRTTAYVYDPMNRIQRVTNAEGEPLIYTYDAAGNVVETMDALSQTATYRYDSANRLVSTLDDLSHTTVYGYDPAGRVDTVVQLGVLTTTADDITNTFTYNGAGQLTVVEDGLERDSSTVYNAAGRVQQRTDANGIVTAYEYDGAGRLTAVIENYQPPYGATSELNVRTEYTYDANGNLLTVKDALGNTSRTYTYDARNLPLTSKDALNNTTSMVYTNRGELRSVTDALSQMTVYTYTNLLGQVATIGRPGETIQFAYDPLQRLETMVDGVGTTAFTYDVMDRITQVQDPFAQVVAYEYNDVGNLDSLVTTAYSGTREVQYAYDDLNRLIAVTDWENLVTGYTYDAFGRLATATSPNDVVSSYTYDDAHQVDTIVHRDDSNVVLGSFDYAYDDVGNRTGVVEVMNVVTPTTTTIAYDYDDLYRLTGAVYSDGRSFGYEYDAVGNRTLMVDSAGISTTYVYSDNYTIEQTIVGGVVQPYTWDDNGNLLSDGDYTYTYDSANRLTGMNEIGGTDVYTYTYNGLGYRLSQEMTGTVTADIQYLLDLNSSLPQVLGDEENLYLYGLGRIGEQAVNGGAWEYHHGDALGSVRLLTNDLGQIVQGTNYDPYGGVLDAVPGISGGNSVFGFTGEQTDPTGMLYLRARYYVPNQGRLITRDPWAGIAQYPQTLNPYAYVKSNPVNLIDPSGKCYGPLSFMRETFERINCENLDKAYYIYSHPEADLTERILAKGYIDLFWQSHAMLAFGAPIIVANPVSAAMIVTQWVMTPTGAVLLTIGGTLDNVGSAVAIAKGDTDTALELLTIANIDGELPFADTIVGARYLAGEGIALCSTLFFRQNWSFRSLTNNIPNASTWLTGKHDLSPYDKLNLREYYLQESTMIRQHMPNGPVGSGKNVAIMDYYIDGVYGSEYAVSGTANRSDSVPLPTNRYYQVTDSGSINDTELKLLEHLTSQLQLANVDRNVQGRVIIYTDLAPCDSCAGLPEQVKALFPNIKVEYIYNFPSKSSMSGYFRNAPRVPKP